MIKKWYMVTTISGKEEQVVESLKNRIVSENLSGIFEDFKAMIIPHITPREMQKKLNGENYKTRTKNLFPGYIFIKMNMTNDAWFIVRNTQYVTGLVGSSGQRTKPTPISNLEMTKMDKQVEKIKNDFQQGKIKTTFIPGKIVEIIDGPAKGQIGPIIENDDEKQISIVEIIMFERKTPTEIEHKNLSIKE